MRRQRVAAQCSDTRINSSPAGVAFVDGSTTGTWWDTGALGAAGGIAAGCGSGGTGIDVAVANGLLETRSRTGVRGAGTGAGVVAVVLASSSPLSPSLSSSTAITSGVLVVAALGARGVLLLLLLCTVARSLSLPAAGSIVACMCISSSSLMCRGILAFASEVKCSLTAASTRLNTKVVMNERDADDDSAIDGDAVHRMQAH